MSAQTGASVRDVALPDGLGPRHAVGDVVDRDRGTGGDPGPTVGDVDQRVARTDAPAAQGVHRDEDRATRRRGRLDAEVADPVRGRGPGGSMTPSATSNAPSGTSSPTEGTTNRPCPDGVAEAAAGGGGPSSCTALPARSTLVVVPVPARLRREELDARDGDHRGRRGPPRRR